MTFTELGFKTISDEKEITFNDKVIKVRQYVPTLDKRALINITLQNSWNGDGFVDPILYHCFFYANVILMYTDIEVDKDGGAGKWDLPDIYDMANSTGLLNAILEAIPEDEFNELFEFSEETVAKADEAKMSVSSTIQKLIDDLPANAEAAKKMMDEFDPDKYEKVVSFAEAANGNRPIQ